MPAPNQPAARQPKRNAPNESTWIEIPVFIHGISPTRDPVSSQTEYYELLSRVKAHLQKHGKIFSTHEIFVTWGVPTIPPQSKGTDQYLAQAERQIHDKVKEAMGSDYTDLTGLTSYVRDLLFYGISDLFYYISDDGENDLRKHVFSYISNRINELDRPEGKHFSLTIFGHSAGSIIAHDLLFHLFGPSSHATERDAHVLTEMDRLRAMISEGRLRVRHLYTFGSPLSVLILRATTLVNKFLQNETLQPKDLGLVSDSDLPNPRWVNFWTKHDLASYPIGFFYDNADGVIEDHPLSAPLSPVAAHGSYWTSDEMAEYIAKTF